MDFRMTIEINKEIMRLIKSKYPEIFPTGYSGPDYTYYKQLERDIEEAERHNSYFDKKDHADES